MESVVTQNLRAARMAVVGIFFLNGFGFANWVVRIPAVKEKLGLGEGLLGLALLGLAVGSLLSMPLTGGLVTRLGSRPVVISTALLLSVTVPLPALAPSLPLLVAALLLAGASMGALDVSMNAQAVAVEKEYRAPIMSSFHAAFSAGGLAGAVTGGLVTSFGVGIEAHLLGIAVLLLVVFAPLYQKLLPASTDVSDEGPAFARPTRALAGLGVVAFCVLLGEGAMADWSALYLDDVLGTGPGLAAAGYAIFSLMMVVGRLAGDRLDARFGPVAIVRAGGAAAATGLALSVLVGTPFAALAGFGLVGLGLSFVFPVTLSAAGGSPDTSPAAGIAAVSTAGYFGFLMGPPLIGLAAELITLRWAILIVAFLSASIVVLAESTRKKA